MNILDAYYCDKEPLDSLFERLYVIGDRVDLPDGIYANTDDGLGTNRITGAMGV